MILSKDSIKKANIITPYTEEKTYYKGFSYGPSAAGYDVRIDQDIVLEPQGFVLASIMEHMNIPTNVLAIMHDKSTWARLGLAVQNTLYEPGWKGYGTIELSNHSKKPLTLERGVGIAQVIFHVLDTEVEAYSGRYQDQPREPVAAIMARDSV